MTQEDLLLQVYYFALVLARIIGLLIIAPIFGSKAIPNRIKLALAVVISIVLMSVVPTDGISVPDKLLVVVFQIIIELFIGFIQGFILLLTFIAIQLSGQFIDRRMGFAMANIMDPQSGIQSPLVGQFKNILVTLIFLELNGHHYLLKLLNDSFEIIPMTNFNSSSELIWILLRSIGDLFPLSFKLALPIIAILFIVDLSFGLIARTVPQMNVFMLGLPTKILVGLIFLSLILPSYINFLGDLFMRNVQEIYNILKLMTERG